MDLMALGDALLARDDELALACVLKSPLFGFDDADLMKLAPERAGLLEDALFARAGENPRWRAAAERLRRLRPEARRLRPFDFYARVLGRERGRAAMIARLGPEAADALDEMLALARSYENVEVPSLAGFLAFLRRGGAEAKRDMEAGRDEVRVMTVHGAKGLEAPYVILADTTSGPMTRRAAGLLRVELPDGRRAALHAPSRRTTRRPWRWRARRATRRSRTSIAACSMSRSPAPRARWCWPARMAAASARPIAGTTSCAARWSRKPPSSPPPALPARSAAGARPCRKRSSRRRPSPPSPPRRTRPSGRWPAPCHARSRNRRPARRCGPPPPACSAPRRKDRRRWRCAAASCCTG